MHMSPQRYRKPPSPTMSEFLALVLPGPWIDWPTGVGYRQDAGMGCRG